MPSPDGRCEPDPVMSANVSHRRSFGTVSRTYDSPAGVATLVGLVQMIGVVAVLVGLGEAAAGVVFHEPRANDHLDRLDDARPHRLRRVPPAVRGDGDSDRLTVARGDRHADRLEPDR